MPTVMNLLRGTVTVTARGLFPERLINLCAQQGITFWGLEWLEDTAVRMTIRLACVKRLEPLAERVGCQLEWEERRGLPQFLSRFRRRYAFLLGLALSVTAVFFLSRFILVIQVEGCEETPPQVVLAELRRQGLRPGAYGPALDRNRIAQEALKTLDDLSWMGINLYGTRAVVQVRQAQPTPEIENDGGFYHIVAETDGIVLHLQPEQGDAAVEEGAVVARGDVLISGVVSVEPPRYSQAPVYYFTTHARGKVWARTWRTLNGEIPLSVTIKAEQREKKIRWALEVFGRHIPLGGQEDPDGHWQLREERHTLSLPGVGTLPAALVCRTWQLYGEQQGQVDLTAAQTLLENRLKKELERLIGEGGQVLSVHTAARAAGGLLNVTLTAECEEEIGQERPAPERDRPPAEVTLPQ